MNETSDSPQKVFRQLSFISFAYMSLTILASFILIVMCLDLSMLQLKWGLVIMFLVAPALWLVHRAALRRDFRPIQDFLKAKAQGHWVEPLVHGAQARILNLPAIAVVRIMALQGPFGLLCATVLMVLFNRWVGTNYEAWQIGGMWTMIFVTVAGNAIFEYFAFLDRVEPLMGFTGRPWEPGKTPGVFHIGLRAKFFTLSFFANLVPLSVLGLSIMLKFSHTLREIGVQDIDSLMAPLWQWVLVLTGFGMFATLGMSYLMTRYIMGKALGLLKGMVRVQREEFPLRLEITSTDEFARLNEGFNRMSQGLHERKLLREALGRYIEPALVEEVVRRGATLGGEVMTASVLFADIRDFTELSELLSAQEIIGLLNEYFGAVSPPIREAGGWINKFGGDSLLAVFGAPVSRPDHAACAVKAALQMRKALVDFNARQRESRGPQLRIGMGLHCGELVIGNIGDSSRMEYTVIGDIVNMASRIQALHKKWGTSILLSSQVYLQTQDIVSAKAMPPVTVSGKSEPLLVYALD